MNFTPEQQRERDEFVRNLRGSLGCIEGESIRCRIAIWKQALQEIADTPMKDDGLPLIQIARRALNTHGMTGEWKCTRCGWAGREKEVDSYKNTFSCPHCGHIFNDDIPAEVRPVKGEK